MKLVDKMKDERLGIAILYNFSKGYEKPVPMELYDIVLPFIYDNINKAEDGFFVCKNKKWGTVNLEGKVIVDTKYQIKSKS